MPDLLNRSAVIVSPKKKFMKWVNEVDPLGELEVTEEELNGDPNIYLIHELISGDEEEPRLIMEKNYLEIVIQEFAAWWTDDKDWPVIKSLKEFEEYFLWKFHSMVIDVTEDDLEIEEV